MSRTGRPVAYSPSVSTPGLLFVYGSLMPEAPADGLPGEVRRALASCRDRGAATIRGTLFSARAYPAMTLDDDAEVRGRLLGLPSEEMKRSAILAAFDDYEAVARGLFRREIAEATNDAGERVACYVYTFLGDTSALPRVDGGDWLAYNRGR